MGWWIESSEVDLIIRLAYSGEFKLCVLRYRDSEQTMRPFQFTIALIVSISIPMDLYKSHWRGPDNGCDTPVIVTSIG